MSFIRFVDIAPKTLTEHLQEEKALHYEYKYLRKIVLHMIDIKFDEAKIQDAEEYERELYAKWQKSYVALSKRLEVYRPVP
jgi:hypothetical protein